MNILSALERSLKERSERNGENNSQVLCASIFSGLVLVKTTQDNVNETCSADKAVGITFTELRDALDEDKVVIVDVRSREEIEKDGFIPKSNNIPVNEIEEAFKLPSTDFRVRYGFEKPVPTEGNLVISCLGGVRALRAWRLLNPLGFCSARVYYGSFDDWKKNGGKIMTS